MKVKVGLALSGGGARGFAHIGVIKSLEKHGIPIYAISGVSAGALFGGVYASGASTKEIEDICYSTTYRKVMSIVLDFSRRSGGLIKGVKIDNFLSSILRKKRIENFPIKFLCTATDLISGKVIYFKKGPASLAIRASGSIPGIFKPVEYDGKHLVDGGVLEPISLSKLKEFGTNVNIGVDLTVKLPFPKKMKEGKKLNIKDSLYSSYLLMQKKSVKFEFKKNRDFIRIRPNVDWIRMLEFWSPETAKKGVKEGERVMNKNIPKLKEMIENYQKK